MAPLLSRTNSIADGTARVRIADVGRRTLYPGVDATGVHNGIQLTPRQLTL
ncbi:hypothetical protein [Streptomyces sp. RPT161]|uniref:hypothetical protein n=1 Tax=Streptomyces sp. RPT161 TaxID=3015993 RepID=UPI0022B9293A|nr:hypothetical protein [Streptomyces sp. RPT161]